MPKMQDLVPQTKEIHFASDDEVLIYAHIKEPIDIRNYSEFVEVEEEKVLKAWINQERSEEIESNDYSPIIFRASFFIKHGLTPIYYADSDGSRMMVTSEEYVNRKFN